MNKRLIWIPLLLSVCLMLCCLTACSLTDLAENPYFGQTQTTPPPSGSDTPATPDNGTHTHSWGTLQHDTEGHWQVCTTCQEIGVKTAHTAVTDTGSDATCGTDGLTDGTHCTDCARVLVAQQPIPATGKHTLVPCELKLPTYTEDGCISGEECTVCGTVTEGDHILPALENTRTDYAYRALSDRKNGTALQSFYTALYADCVAFHSDAAVDAIELTDGNYPGWIALTTSYEDWALSSEDAFLVLEALQSDCPLFYWIDNMRTTEGHALNVYTDVLYANGEDRAEMNATIARGIARVGCPTGSDYARTYYLHDLLIDELTYAYQADGVTPEDAVWAHNITGYFAHGTGVCETYAETCQLFLNYWDIENVAVTGTADGDGHAWNMIRMDNGTWYWFDLTWDDQPSMTFGRIYDYFCQTDTAFGMDERTTDTDVYPLPACGTSPYTGDLPAVGTAFTQDGITYTVVGYDEVELTLVELRGAVHIPMQITHAEHIYDVVSVGRVEMVGGDATLMPVFEEGITAVTLPATIRNIRGGAFTTASLTSVSIDAHNPYLLAEGGGIYQKDPCILVCYLPGITEQTFTLREGTVGIARFAFLNGYTLSVIIPDSLEFLEDYAFYHCNVALTLTYQGTKDAWLALNFEQDSLPTGCIVVCEDGVLQVE